MAISAPRKLSLIKPDRQLFAGGDENALTKQVLATHSEEPLEFPVTPLLSLVEQIFLRAKLNTHQAYTCVFNKCFLTSNHTKSLFILKGYSNFSCKLGSLVDFVSREQLELSWRQSKTNPQAQQTY